MNSSAELLKSLQMQFLMAVARWTNYGTEVEATSLGLPNLVCLLQSVGYTIRRIDSVSPDSISPLRDNQKGTKVVVTCGHSGQRCFLELQEEDSQCNCIIKNNEQSEESFWEVTATNSSLQNSLLIETGSAAVPAVSKELNSLLRHVLICLTHMIQGTLKDVEPKDTGLGKSASSSSPKKDAKRLSGFIQELVNIPIIISSPTPNKRESPRYGSLDTLSTNTDEIIPLPGILTPKIPRTKQSVITASSPNINLFGTNEPTKSSESTLEEDKNVKVIKLLKEAISVLENNGEGISPLAENILRSPKETTSSTAATTDFVSTKIQTELTTTRITRPKSASSPSLATKKTFKSSSTSRIPSTPLDITRTLSGSVKHPLKFNKPVDQTKSPKPEDGKDVCKRKKGVNLYAHIKSTIPKASPSGNYIKKKS